MAIGIFDEPRLAYDDARGLGRNIAENHKVFSADLSGLEHSVPSQQTSFQLHLPIWKAIVKETSLAYERDNASIGFRHESCGAGSWHRLIGSLIPHMKRSSHR